jgi:hypothetical protein
MNELPPPTCRAYLQGAGNNSGTEEVMMGFGWESGEEFGEEFKEEWNDWGARSFEDDEFDRLSGKIVFAKLIIKDFVHAAKEMQRFNDQHPDYKKYIEAVLVRAEAWLDKEKQESPDATE